MFIAQNVVQRNPKYLLKSAIEQRLSVIYTSVVQPCRHSPHVATGDLNVATDRFIRNESIMINTLHTSKILTKVATTKHLSQQFWKMWRQREYVWTPLIYTMPEYIWIQYKYAISFA
jgi:hypothetical protein